MSAQGVVDAVKDGVQQVADKLQSATVSDSTAAPTTTDEAKPNETKPNETKPQTLLDEVTGEYVSKSELKKRQKQRQKDIQKAERESTRQAPPTKKKNAAEDEAQLNPNVSGRHSSNTFGKRNAPLTNAAILRDPQPKDQAAQGHQAAFLALPSQVPSHLRPAQPREGVWQPQEG